MMYYHVKTENTQGFIRSGWNLLSDCWQSALRKKGIANGILASRNSKSGQSSFIGLICLLDTEGEIERATGGSAKGGERRNLVVDQPGKSDLRI